MQICPPSPVGTIPPEVPKQQTHGCTRGKARGDVCKQVMGLKYLQSVSANGFNVRV